jgi:tetratricopeptide (TPR) repeat protein
MVGALRWAVLTLAATLASATAEADAARSERRTLAILEAIERDLHAGKRERARARVESALAESGDVRLAARYGELLLPFEAARGSASLRALEPAAAQLARALTRLDETTADRATLRRARLHGAFALAIAGHYDDALALVYAAGELQDAITVACLRAVATVAAQRAHLERAEQALAAARQYMLQDRAVMAELGAVQLARGKSREALTVLGERFAIEPASLGARRDLAYALLASGRASEALSLLEAERAECQQEPGCALEAARAALEAERPDRALAYAERRLALLAGDVDALFIIGDAHVREGSLDKARAAYAAVLRAQPESVRAKQALEQLASSNGAGR